MSSFICTPKHFNSVANYVAFTAINHDHLKYGKAFRDYRKISPFLAEKKLLALFDTLKELSVLCVTLQYKHHYTGKLDQTIEAETKAIKQQTNIELLTPISCYKLLGCITYQIEVEHLKELRELTPEETAALNFCEDFKNDLAHHIVCELPEYDKAKYTID